jgi:hypothetical protein
MDSRRAAVAAFRNYLVSRPISHRARAGIMCAALVIIGIGGCSLFHHKTESTQQKFIEALERGNAPEANQIWLNMNEKERADWSHSVGMKPNVSKENVEAQLMRHAQQQADQDDDNSSESTDGSAGTSSIQDDGGNIDSQMIEMPGLDADPSVGGLQSLPGVSGTDSSGSEIPTVP